MVGYFEIEFDWYDSVVDGDFSGNQFVFLFNWMIVVGVNYIVGCWSGGLYVNWVDEMFFDFQNEIEFDVWILLNVQIVYWVNCFIVMVYGKNLLDEVYWMSEGVGFVFGMVVVCFGDFVEYGF